MKKLLFLLIASFAFVGCEDYENIDEFEKLEGRKVDVEDDELQEIILELQIKILDGSLSVDSLANVMKVLGVSTTITAKFADFEVDATKKTQLQTKLTTYLNLVSSTLNSEKFVDNCDGLLFTSLLKSGGFDVDLTKAESDTEKGRWYRTPSKDCLSTGNSQSTISRDMMLGLAMGLWNQGNDDAKQAVERTLSYAKENDWFIGEAVDEQTRIARAFMSPGLAATFYEIQFKLGGEENTNARLMPQYYDPTSKGFTAHLDMIHILVRGLMRRGISESDLATVTLHAARQQNNQLYKAILLAFTTGKMDPVVDSLLETTHFPASTLPTTHVNHCTEYLWQRDEDPKDWDPCTDKQVTHSAVDFIFLAKFVLGGLKVSDTVDPTFSE